jgi:hypothetical protein
LFWLFGECQLKKKAAQLLAERPFPNHASSLFATTAVETGAEQTVDQLQSYHQYSNNNVRLEFDSCAKKKDLPMRRSFFGRGENNNSAVVVLFPQQVLNFLV